MKRVVSIAGSPRYRDGNTAQFVSKACEGARDAGAEVVDIILYKLKLQGCIDCNLCETREPLGMCKLKDDFPENMEIVKASDAIILSSPVYHNNVTAPMKAWIDRCNCMLYPNFVAPIAKMPVAIIITSGYPFSYPIPPLDPMIEKLKAVSGEIRYAFDKEKVYDMTGDCLRAVYAHCVYLGLTVIGALEVTGLEHGKNVAPTRLKELEQAYHLGQKLVESIPEKTREQSEL